MSLPFGHGGTTFERFLQELPEDCRELALEFKAFTRSRKIKTPEQPLRTDSRYRDPEAPEGVRAVGEGIVEPIVGGGGAVVRRSSTVRSGRWLDGAGTWGDGDRVSAAPGGGLVIPLCVPNERDPPPQQLMAGGATINLFLAAFDTTRRDRYCRDKTVENPPAESPARLRSARCG